MQDIDGLYRFTPASNGQDNRIYDGTIVYYKQQLFILVSDYIAPVKICANELTANIKLKGLTSFLSLHVP